MIYFLSKYSAMLKSMAAETLKTEILTTDVIIVGAGPAGLSAAIRVKQLSKEINTSINVIVLEKAGDIGGHIISGAVLEPRALNELIPDWKEKGAPVSIAVTEDEFVLLSKTSHLRLPTPPQMRNKGNYIISLGLLCRWLAKEAESLGVEIFPGFAATGLIYDDNGRVKGITTNAVGIDKQGNKKANYQPGMEIHASYVLVAEGCRGSLTKILTETYELRKQYNGNGNGNGNGKQKKGMQKNGKQYHADPQTYGLGIKELWEISPEKHQEGKVIHTIGWPLDQKTYGGSFIYHAANRQLSIGFVVGLDYENPYLDPYEEFQRFKHHPFVAPLLEGGQRLCYGARAINEGGFQSIPQLSFPGGAIIGCAAGFLNVPKIKGNHTAMKSGMLAAESVVEALKKVQQTSIPIELISYEERFRKSWIYDELKLARNIRPAFRFGLWGGLLYSAFDTYVLRGRAPWTFHHKADHLCLKPAKDFRPIHYPKHDGKISFDKLSSVALSNTFHEEDQPPHLILKDPNIELKVNIKIYDAPEQRYCPAQVYEILKDESGGPYLQINATNCVHCKTCDIKDPTQNIDWVPPEGGGGPNYPNM